MKEHINNFGLSTMIISICNSVFYGTFSSYILTVTKTDSLLSIIIGFIISLLLSKILVTLFDRYENKDFVEINIKIFKKFSSLTVILFTLCSFISYTLLTQRLSSFLSNQYLIDTKGYVILLMILGITYYISSKGIDTIIRVSIITFYISISIFLFDFLSLIRQINLHNYLPLFNVNIKSILITSILFSIYFIVPLIHIYSIKKDEIINKKSFNKYYYLSITVSFIIILLNMITTIGVSGITISNMFDYPIYITLKRIKLFSFLDSLEDISIMLWILFIINTSNMMLLFIRNNIKELVHPKNTSIIMIVLVVISFIISVFLINPVFIESHSYMIIPLIVQATILILLIISIIKDRFN